MNSNDDEMDEQYNYGNITIDFFVQQDKVAY